MKPKVAIFVHQPACSVDSINGLILALNSRYDFKLFSKDEVESTFFNDVECVCVPGGIGDADRFKHLMKYNKDHVRNFVKQGGKYLGICMGAYWAGKHYFNLLDHVNVVQYIKRPHTDTRRPHPKAISVNWQGQEERMYFYDGCAFVGSNLNTIATYKNGDPMAIVQNNIGLIGCHPESQQYWYNKNYLKPHWHQGRHYNLLSEFIQLLDGRFYTAYEHLPLPMERCSVF